jgi:hypothetical protein
LKGTTYRGTIGPEVLTVAEKKRLAEVLRDTVKGRSDLEKFEDVKSIGREYPEVLDAMTDDAQTRRMSLEEVRKSIVVPWIESAFPAKDGAGAKRASSEKPAAAATPTPAKVG